LTKRYFLRYGKSINSKALVETKKIDGKEEVMADVIVPMEGKVIKINVKVGDTVSADDEIIIMEAMKMEMPVSAGVSGVVKEIKVSVGQTFPADSAIMAIE
jgi:biotin carboxyl carrier protein